MKAAIPIVTFFVLTFSLLTGDRVLADIKEEKKVLICNGRYVEPKKIEGFSDGVWFFTNGYARNCEVKDV